MFGTTSNYSIPAWPKCKGQPIATHQVAQVPQVTEMRVNKEAATKARKRCLITVAGPGACPAVVWCVTYVQVSLDHAEYVAFF